MPINLQQQINTFTFAITQIFNAFLKYFISKNKNFDNEIIKFINSADIIHCKYFHNKLNMKISNIAM